MNHKFELDSIQTLEVTATEYIIKGKLYGDNCDIQFEVRDTQEDYLAPIIALIKEVLEKESSLRMSLEKNDNGKNSLTVTDIKSGLSVESEIIDESFILFQRRKKRALAYS